MAMAVVLWVFLCSCVFYAVYDIVRAARHEQTITEAVRAAFRRKRWLYWTSLTIAVVLIAHLYFGLW